MADDWEQLLRQLRRQIDLNKETWLNVIDRTISPVEGRRPTALDVGCGPGLVMELLASRMDIVGVDRSEAMARRCGDKGLPIVRGRGQELPFPDNSFDVVYCSFVLTWVGDPAKFMQEMLRVSRRWVFCLAEPDIASRIDHPSSLRPLTDCIIKSVKAVGGNLTMGRDLRSIFWDLGYRCTVGVSSGVHGDDIEVWLKDEWPWVEEMLSPQPQDPPVESVKAELYRCIENGSAFTFTPIFNAVVDKARDKRIT